MTNPASKNLKHIYFNNLDACRFLAAFAVFVFHFSNEMLGLFPALQNSAIFDSIYIGTSKGGLGVNFFFVLSGFLITYLILNERKRTGKFHLVKFLIRRSLRIWPLYFLIVFIGFVLFPWLIEGYSTVHNALNYVLFLANFDEIKYGAADGINFLTSPWSVAVEEQFYLFWGVAVFGLFRIRQLKLIHLILLLYAVSFWFRWMHWDEERIIYYHTLAVCQDILTGAFVGLSLFQGKKWLNKIQNIPRWGVVFVYILGLGLCVGKNILFKGEFVVVERFILSLFFAFVILDQIRGNHSFFKFGRIKIFNYLGRISYGLYLYHLVVMYVLLRYFFDDSMDSSWTLFIFFTISALLTIGISALSFHFFESKFLSLKPKK